MYFRARMYSTELGRFVSRDPLGYVDGYGLQGAYFVPFDADPFGQTIKSRCPLDSYLDSQSVAYHRIGPDSQGYYWYMLSGSYKADVQGILGTMINSFRIFTVKGSDEKGCIENLKLHVQARLEIVKRLRANEPGPENCQGCLHASMHHMLQGIGKAGAARQPGDWKPKKQGDKPSLSDYFKWNTIEDSSPDETDWVPGDLGYVDNPNQDKWSGCYHILYQGQNVIYLGQGSFWGHGLKGNKTLDEIKQMMKNDPDWNTQWQPTTNPDREGIVESYRWYPSAGLERK